MRNPGRIYSITALLNSCWLLYPDLRFFQVVILLQTEYNKSKGNMVLADVFNVEDEDFEKFLEKYLTEITK